MEKVVNQQHPIDTKATPFCQASGGQKSTRERLADFEVPLHGSKSTRPCSGDFRRGTCQDRKAQRREPRNAVEAFLQVSRQTADGLTCAVSHFNLEKQEIPKVGGLAPLPVAINTLVHPGFGPLQEVSRLKTGPS